MEEHSDRVQYGLCVISSEMNDEGIITRNEERDLDAYINEHYGFFSGNIHIDGVYYWPEGNAELRFKAIRESINREESR